MIVWSRGLGKQRLPLDLADAELKIEEGRLVLRGVIEPVCWNYAIRLGPEDLAAFLRHLAEPGTARFLAERGGLLGPFVLGMLAAAPRVVVTFLASRWSAALNGGKTKEGEDHALLV